MAKLGFLGLGIMGGPMAGHLLKAGHEVALWSHRASKAAALAGLGKALVCETPKQVAENADVIFLCVGDTDMSAKVTLGENGLIEGLRPGAIIADCSTVAPSYARRAAATLAEKGAAFLDSPVTGSKPGAEGATLTFMIGGDQAVYEKVKPFMELMGKRFYYCGGAGLGLHAKLTQNLVLSNLLQAFNEGMVLATKAGVDPELMLDILDNSAAKSGLVSFKAPYVFRRDFTTNFSVRWMHKDIGLMLDTGNEMEVPLPLTALTQQMFRMAIAEGVGEEDICSTIKVLERQAGVEVKKSSQK
ncbi:NAD(P)-dependent oxidoreductase [uncultured Paludibaculum sp.]|uniref:NAD(P)-dependent oxidoreductase n=1 Tax=uncultured Paludibaculum sp. TaxID=1765020 RepID=UPI002AAB167C|nr:NAD(P)-dependent oxidoreductase [uncultured Paludibaculum sp.]